MKNIVRYLLTISFALLALSCRNDEPLDTEVPEGYVTIRFMMDVAVQDQIWTKAVDPDGGGVQQMQVFCFDENGIFITTVKAKLNHDAPETGSTVSMSGTVEVSVPEHAEILQLVGNQNLTFFEEDSYRGMTEIELMSSLEASAGRMIYWARKTVDELKACNTRETAVKLLRNQAMFTLEVSDEVNFVQQGWIIVNTNAFGTVAPYNYEKGEFEIPTHDNPFVTLPDNTSRLADYLDVRTNDVEYVFESPNSASNPVDFIVKGSLNGGPSLYYRISIIDEDGINMPILRNHHYTICIEGALSYGKETFAEALQTPPTNNVWVSVSQNIASVSDGDYRLTVDKTSVVIAEDDFVLPYRDHELSYTLESLTDGALTTPEVSWEEGNEVARSPFDHVFDPATGKGIIRVYLNEMGDKGKREGVLVIRHGRLTRTIKVTTVKKQTFVPAWITTNIYGGNSGENVTMMFHISEDFPQEMFPMDVLVSVNDLDVRNASGMVLPVILRGEEGYGEENGIGYKYVLTVQKPGVQRIYLKTILGHETGETVSVTIEADHFESLTKTATFVSETNNRILLHNLRSYVGAMPADEVIYYYMVPQKKHARVEFTSHVGQVYRTRPAELDYATFTDALGEYYVDYVIPNNKFTDPYNVDEFLLYSENLEHNHDLPGDTYYFNFYKIDASKWSPTAGRVLGFFRNERGTPGEGATFHLRTMIPKADEVVRIASNPYGSPSITTGEPGDPGDLPSAGYLVEKCTGTGRYKSAVFELTTFHPFQFSAQIKVGEQEKEKIYGDIVSGANENPVTDVALEYLPGQPVKVEFDVTSFMSDLTSVTADQQLSVDPFGEPFDIYIDAPMLELDKSAIDPSWLVPDADGVIKLRENPSKPGQFIYRVDADREKERLFGSSPALSKDEAKLDLFRQSYTPVQTGERKAIPFRTKNIVSAGDITISSDEDVVVYYPKRFRVSNASMKGRIVYMRDGVPTAVPAGSFVPFEMAPSYNRIGTIAIADDGEFELRLRSEYVYSWAVGVVKFQFTYGGVIYEAQFDSLAELYEALSGDEDVVLKVPTDEDSTAK